MRKVVQILALTVSVAGLTAAFVAWRSHAQSFGRTPLSFTKHETFYRPTGEVVETRDTIWAISRTGAEVEIKHKDNNGAILKKIIVDPISRKRIVSDGMTESITTTYLGEASATKLQQKPMSCTEELSPQHSSLLGYDVLKVAKEFDPGKKANNPLAPAARTESWVAPALDCLALKTTAYISKGGKPSFTSIMEVTNLVVGDPDPSLFTVPSEYTERSPSAVITEYNRRHPEGPLPLTGFDGRDAAYNAQQKK